MRKLGSQAEKEQKKKRNMLILSILMLLLLVVSTAGYALIYSPNPDPLPQGEIENGAITFQGNRWIVNHLGRQFYFTFSPESETIKEIPVDSTFQLQDYLSKSVYIDSENPAIYQEIGSSLQGYAARISEGCYEACDRDLPEKSCDDYVIVWRDSTEKKVYQVDNCVFIEGDMETVDAFLFKTLGI